MVTESEDAMRAELCGISRLLLKKRTSDLQRILVRLSPSTRRYSQERMAWKKAAMAKVAKSCSAGDDAKVCIRRSTSGVIAFWPDVGLS